MVSLSRSGAGAGADEIMTNLTDLSPEILHTLFCFVDALTLSSLSKTCHQLRDFIARDDLLWRRVYSARFVSLNLHHGHLLLPCAILT